MLVSDGAEARYAGSVVAESCVKEVKNRGCYCGAFGKIYTAVIAQDPFSTPVISGP